MNEPHDPNQTVDVPALEPADSLDAGLAAGFGRPMAPRSSLGNLRPVLLKEAEGESEHIVKPKSDAMPPKEEIGDRYQLSGEVARGGMGAVLRGRDVDLGRDLAVKVLLEKYAHHPEVARRFIEEAQIGGQLQHPGVVPVYDIGRFGDRPFFTMKLVKGKTLSAILEEREDATADRPRLLGIALKVSETLAYAHAKGVIHRDLKPANIMVGAFGEVQVMDWGLAKVLADGGIADEERAAIRERERREDVTTIRTARSTGTADGFGTETEMGSLLGTPAYMPPEQANGDIANLNRRADVFGLGAILCEILTGQPPYVGRSGEEVRRKAANGDLADATARLDACGADAELIALTKYCLSPEAIDRPKDAQAVTDGLSVYLNGVQERLQTAERERHVAEVRANEQLKRRKVQAALGLTFTALIVLGGAVAWWSHDRRRTQEARTELALHATEVLLGQAAADPDNPVSRWQDAQGSLTKTEGVLGDDATEAGRTRLESLRTAIAAGLKEAQANETLLEQIDHIRSEKGEMEFDDAFAAAFEAAGLDADALTPAEFAKRLAAKPVAVRKVVAPTLDVWAIFRRRDLFTSDVKVEKGVAHLFELARTIDPDSWRNKLRSALQERNLIALHELAENAVEKEKQGPTHLWLLGLGHAFCGDAKGAADVLRPAVQKYPGDYALTLELSFSIAEFDRSSIGQAAATSTNSTVYQQAEPYVRAALALRPNSRSRTALAISLSGQERLVEAEPEYQEAIRLAPRNSKWICNYAGFLEKAGRENESLEQYRNALTANPGETRALPPVAAAILKEGGSVDDVIAMYRKAAAYPPHHEGVRLLALALEGHGRIEEAMDVLKKAIADEPTWRRYREQLGQILNRQNKRDEAVALFREAVASDPTDAIYHDWLGLALEQKKDFDGAVAAYEEAVRLDPALFYSYNSLARIYIQQNEPERAVPFLRKTIALRPRYERAHTDLLNALASLNRLDSAVEDYKKMIARDPRDPFWHYWLGKSHQQMKDNMAAAEAYRDAIELFPKYYKARVALISLLRNSKEYGQVVELCREGISLEPKQDDYNNYLEFSLSAMGKTDEAIAACRAAVAADPKSNLARFRLVSALSNARRFDDAVYELELLIEADPKEAGLHFQLGRLRERQGRVKEAIAAFRRAKELAPSDYILVHNLALGLANAGEIAEASKLLTELASRDQTSNDGLYAGIACRAIKDGPGYEKVRKELLDRYGAGSDFTGIDHTVKVWLLDPKLTDELPVITALAERGVTEGKLSPYYRQFQGYVEMTRGLAALRNGEWSRAIEWCDAAPGHVAVGRLRTECDAACRAIKAMALYRQGGEERQTTARKELASAEKILTEGENDLVVATTINHLFARILADEAAELLNGMKNEPMPPSEMP